MNPTGRPGQIIVNRIWDRIKALRERQIKIRMYWIPSHKGNTGNELADKLAKQAISCSEDHDFRRPVSTYKAVIRTRIAEEWRLEWTVSQNGKHLKKIDDNLPAKRALRLYGSLSRRHIYIFWHSSEVVTPGWRAMD